MRDNKKQEVIQHILNDGSTIEVNRRKVRNNAIKVIKQGKKFSEMYKTLEQLQKQRKEDLQRREHARRR